MNEEFSQVIREDSLDEFTAQNVLVRNDIFNLFSGKPYNKKYICLFLGKDFEGNMDRATFVSTVLENLSQFDSDHETTCELGFHSLFAIQALSTINADIPEFENIITQEIAEFLVVHIDYVQQGSMFVNVTACLEVLKTIICISNVSQEFLIQCLRIDLLQKCLNLFQQIELIFKNGKSQEGTFQNEIERAIYYFSHLYETILSFPDLIGEEGIREQLVDVGIWLISDDYLQLSKRIALGFNVLADMAAKNTLPEINDFLIKLLNDYSCDCPMVISSVFRFIVSSNTPEIIIALEENEFFENQIVELSYGHNTAPLIFQFLTDLEYPVRANDDLFKATLKLIDLNLPYEIYSSAITFFSKFIENIDSGTLVILFNNGVLDRITPRLGDGDECFQKDSLKVIVLIMNAAIQAGNKNFDSDLILKLEQFDFQNTEEYEEAVQSILENIS